MYILVMQLGLFLGLALCRGRCEASLRCARAAPTRGGSLGSVVIHGERWWCRVVLDEASQISSEGSWIECSKLPISSLFIVMEVGRGWCHGSCCSFVCRNRGGVLYGCNLEHILNGVLSASSHFAADLHGRRVVLAVTLRCCCSFNLLVFEPKGRLFLGSDTAFIVFFIPSGLVPGDSEDGHVLQLHCGGGGPDCVLHFYVRVLFVKSKGCIVIFIFLRTFI